MIDDIEPLSPGLWFDRIEKVGKRKLGSLENSLRHALHLLQLTPRPFRHSVRLTLDEAEFEALLDAGRYDDAARHLVAQPTALSIDHNSGGSVRAVISCVILGRAIDGTGETVADAVLDAWTNCLLALRTEFGTDVHDLSNRLPQASI